MGNADSAIIKNTDKRTSRREHRAIFEASAQRFREKPFPAPAQAAQASSVRGIRVCVRKRPIFKHESDAGEWDAITCPISGRVVVHDARMHPDMVKLYMNHHDFEFDATFGETADNAAVYSGAARPLVLAVLEGQSSTVMMYGQTGSGKTFTMKSIYEQAAEEIFEGAQGREVTVTFVELLGDNCFDMFNQGVSAQLATAADGSVHPYPCAEVAVGNSAELLSLIDLAGKLRATAATGVHDQSSRSHAVCRIFVNGPAADSEGCLTLVDLAGSEHRIDNAEHNPERRKEGAKINASLAALKECIRARAANAKFIAFRQNRLTQILRGCFLSDSNHDTVVIATVSPCSKDTEHSLNTVRHACIMDGQGEGKGKQGSHLQGGHITKELLGEVNVSKLARERKQAKKEGSAPPEPMGAPKAKPAHQSKESNTGARAALDRRCVRALDPVLSERLLEARAAWGTMRQRVRIARPPALSEAMGSQEDPPAACSASSAAAKPSAAPRRRSSSQPPASVVATAAMPSLEQSPSSTPSGASDSDRALELFRGFVRDGRGSRTWRKNDMRLINSFVVPLLYGPDTQLDWQNPVLALDELERLVAEAPDGHRSLDGCGAPGAAEADPPGQPLQQAVKSPTGRATLPGRPPLPGGAATRGSGQEPVDAAAAAAGLPAPQKPPPRRASTGETRRLSPGPAQDVGSAPGELPEFRARSTRSASPAGRGVAGVDWPGPVTHQDAIRARRAALEQARQESLQKALANKGAPQSREEEMAGLEQQLGSGRCSAAAAVGLKKRLQSLKAAILREERAATAAARARAEDQDARGSKGASPAAWAAESSSPSTPASVH